MTGSNGMNGTAHGAAEPRGIVETLEGRHILLTGFTGFLGKVWVGFLLDRVPEIGRITLLVRGRRTQDAESRVREAFEQSPALRPLREKHGEGLLAFLSEKIDVLQGDAKLPLLGIDAPTLAVLAPRLDAVVHCAGLTDFAPDPRAAVEVNVTGAEHAADLAALIPSKRLVHVSTCFVAGQVDGHVPEHLDLGVSPNGTRFDVEAEKLAIQSVCKSIDEREGGPKRPAARRGRVDVGTQRAQALGWPNLYTYSKGLAEHSLGARDDVVLTLVRPSVVECAREFPFPGWNEGINTSGPIVWMCSGYAWKVPMRADSCFDVVPVDTVARGMTVAVVDALNDNAAPIYQLASGDHNLLTFDRALDLTALKVRKGYVPSGVSGLERALLTHLDSTPLDHGQDRSVLLPAAQKASRWLRDTFRKFDKERHLPASVREDDRNRLGDKISDASLKLNKTSMLLKSIDQLWNAYQPFVHDHSYRFETTSVRERTARLSADDQARFGWDLESLDWRHYWMEVEIPGLDKWSLPLIRGHEVSHDEGFELGGPLPSATVDTSLPASSASEAEPAREIALGGAE
ncbi:MAG: SDR family oxidoreductase [Sandaracinaceae bacterium]